MCQKSSNKCQFYYQENVNSYFIISFNDKIFNQFLVLRMSGIQLSKLFTKQNFGMCASCIVPQAFEIHKQNEAQTVLTFSTNEEKTTKKNNDPLQSTTTKWSVTSYRILHKCQIMRRPNSQQTENQGKEMNELLMETYLLVGKFFGVDLTMIKRGRENLSWIKLIMLFSFNTKPQAPNFRKDFQKGIRMC